MLTQATIDHTAENRRSEKPVVSIDVIYSKMEGRSYEDLVQWVMHAASTLRLTNTTRYLTRVYVDLLLHNSSHIHDTHYIALTVAALSLAIKFNELRDVADQLTPQCLFQMAQIDYSPEFYFNLEAQIISALRFRFKYTTPYDYIEGFCQKFPWNINFKNALGEILDMTLALPFCAGYSAEQVFYGTVETIFKARKVVLTETQRSVLQSMTDTWERASQLSDLILNSISQFLAE